MINVFIAHEWLLTILEHILKMGICQSEEERIIAREVKEKEIAAYEAYKAIEKAEYEAIEKKIEAHARSCDSDYMARHHMVAMINDYLKKNPSVCKYYTSASLVGDYESYPDGYDAIESNKLPSIFLQHYLSLSMYIYFWREKKKILVRAKLDYRFSTM